MKNTFNILLVEDNDGDVRLIRELLKDATPLTFIISHAPDLQSAISRLTTNSIDCILLDLGLPDSFGIETLIALRNYAPTNASIIILTGLNDTETGLMAVNIGAQDYLIKGQVDSEKLVKSIIYSIERNHLNLALRLELDARKKAELDATEKDLQFNNLANFGLAMVWTSGTDKMCNFFNEQWLRFTGKPIEQELEAGWSKGVHPEDFEYCFNTYISAFELRESFEMEYRLLHSSGDYRWILDMGTPNYNSAGEFIGYIGNCFDINARKQTEQELIKAKEKAEESEIRYRKAQEIGHVGGWEYDIKSKLFWGTEEAKRIYGLNEVSSQFTEDVVMQCVIERERVDKAMVELIKDNKTYDIIFEIIPQNSSEKKIIRSIAEKTTDDIGNPLKISGVLHDITQQKTTEYELIAAKEHAEESDRLKSAFLANMSHEIRTPMNGILGFAELLKEPNLTGEEQKEYISIIEKSGLRMLNIINDIVDISKIEAGLTTIYLSETNINSKIEFIYKFFMPEVEGKGIQLSYINTLPTRESIVKTDSEKLYAILINLVKNAIKFTHSGFIEFGYDIVEGINGQSLLQFFVKDTGIGIPEERQEAIFERFIQADIADSKAYQGAGLGLSIAKAYVEMLGGTIWLESEEGKGSTFYFTLPYVIDSVDPEKVRNFVYIKEASKRIEALDRKLKILIVEDDDISELLLRNILSQFSSNIVSVDNGYDAISICRDNPDFDLVMMDLKIPKLNGYEATKQIRKFNDKVIIVAQSAYGLSKDREKAIEWGCDDFISKPIQQYRIFAILQKFFKKNG